MDNELANTAMSEAFKKINLQEVKLVSNELENGLTLSIINKMVISNHAKKRGNERFDIKNVVDLDRVVRDGLKKGKYIGLIPSSDGNESYLYVHKGMGIHVSTDYESVNTIVAYGEDRLKQVLNNYNEVKNAFMEIQNKQLRKLMRKRKTLKKKTIQDKLNFNVEIAELDRKIFKTKSEKAKKRYIDRKDFLVKTMEEQEKELNDIEYKLRITGGALAYLNN